MARTDTKEKPQPGRILIEETIGWTDNGVLRMFHEDQVVTNPHDIKRLLELGAKYMVVTHE
jgi:hypothetical protein